MSINSISSGGQLQLSSIQTNQNISSSQETNFIDTTDSSSPYLTAQSNYGDFLGTSNQGLIAIDSTQSNNVSLTKTDLTDVSGRVFEQPDWVTISGGKFGNICLLHNEKGRSCK